MHAMPLSLINISFAILSTVALECLSAPILSVGMGSWKLTWCVCNRGYAPKAQLCLQFDQYLSIKVKVTV